MFPTDQFQRPMRDLRISVTDRCNFRCTYCMPADVFDDHFQFLPHSDLLTFEEIDRIARIAVKLGVVKLRITGGEPLVRKGIDQLIGVLNQIPGVNDIAMTSNGVLLPQMAEKLRDAGLKRISISLDTLDDAVFRQMNGDRAGVHHVLAGIQAAERAGLTPIKINAVIKRGVNDHTVVDLARFCKERGYTLRLIEYMDVGTRNGWRMEDVFTARELIERIDAVMPLEPIDSAYFGEVAERWRYHDGSGEIGLIASVTQPFCGTCTRLRVSPKGSLYTCLFAQNGVSLRDPMRVGAGDDEIAALMQSVWTSRADRYSEIRTSETARQSKIEMNYIGG